jgi:hypothetical protein
MYAVAGNSKAATFSGLAKSCHPPADSWALKGGWYVDEESSEEVVSFELLGFGYDAASV